MNTLVEIVQSCKNDFHFVINSKNKKVIAFDLTKNNTALTAIDLTNTVIFEQYINTLLLKNEAIFGIGGYNENREMYKRSTLFDGTTQNRCIHLGVDVWGKATTPVFAPLNGVVHSFAFNNNFGDYGATIILQHQLKGKIFHTLYGHLSLQSITNIEEGMPIKKGQQIATFGIAAENGNWPPHIHFQIIENMEGNKGDYPGVCTFADREKYLANCPDANLILGMMESL